jgi:hypothetical protein
LDATRTRLPDRFFAGDDFLVIDRPDTLARFFPAVPLLLVRVLALVLRLVPPLALVAARFAVRERVFRLAGARLVLLRVCDGWRARAPPARRAPRATNLLKRLSAPLDVTSW